MIIPSLQLSDSYNSKEMKYIKKTPFMFLLPAAVTLQYRTEATVFSMQCNMAVCNGKSFPIDGETSANYILLCLIRHI